MSRLDRKASVPQKALSVTDSVTCQKKHDRQREGREEKKSRQK